MLNNSLGKMGKIIVSNNIKGKAIPNNSSTPIFEVIGEIGATYLVFTTLVFATSSTAGKRQLNISRENEGFSYMTDGTVNIVTGSVPIAVNTESQRKITVSTLQTSGGTLTLNTAYLRVIRLS